MRARVVRGNISCVLASTAALLFAHEHRWLLNWLTVTQRLFAMISLALVAWKNDHVHPQHDCLSLTLESGHF